MADFAATTVTGLEIVVAGNRRIATGSVIVTTAANSEDTVATGLSVLTAVTASFASSAVTSVHTDLNVYPSTVTAGAFVVTHESTINNFPLTFRAEGR